MKICKFDGVSSVPSDEAEEEVTPGDRSEQVDS